MRFFDSYSPPAVDYNKILTAYAEYSLNFGHYLRFATFPRRCACATVGTEELKGLSTYLYSIAWLEGRYCEHLVLPKGYHEFHVNLL